MSIIGQADIPEVGVSSLDRDHRHLVDLICRVQSPGWGAAPNHIRAGVEDLAHHFAHHFSREEMLMRLTGYPDAEPHRQSHAALSARLADFQSLLRRGMFPHDRFRDFLTGPLLLHLHDKDARLKSWMDGFGRRAAA